MQRHFDHTCIAWYPNLTKKLKDRLQVTQNNCMRFCVKLKCREHISYEHFKKVNWPLINQRYKQWATSATLKSAQNSLAYMNVFRPGENIRINTSISYLKLNHPFWKTSTRQNGLSYIRPIACNRIPEILRKTENTNAFKQDKTLTWMISPNLWSIGGFDYAFSWNIFTCFTIVFFNLVLFFVPVWIFWFMAKENLLI